MQICFLRHGEADWPDWRGPDDERPLNEKGAREIKRVARFLRKLGFKADEVLTSPLPRAAQTAEIAARELGLQPKIEPALGHGFDAERLAGLIKMHKANCLVVVGHEPAFSQVIGGLTGGRVKLKKGGVALVETNRTGRRGELRWLFPPKIAKAAS